MSECLYQLHLADCGQKNACSAVTMSSIPETICCIPQSCNTYWTKTVFFSL